MQEQYEDQAGPTIVIVYASYGDGHLQAAKAIREALARRGARRTVLLDLPAAAYPRLDAVTRRVYRLSFRVLPGLYGFVYALTRGMRHRSLFGRLLHAFGGRRARAAIERERPDAVIHTFPVYCVPRTGDGRRVPSCAVVTDYDLHGRWIHPSVDRYYVPTDDMRRELAARGVASHRIRTSGIPLMAGFEAAAEPGRDVRRRFGIAADETVVLVMAGAQGVVPDIASICRLLLDRSKLSVALVCGRNDALASHILQSFAGHPARRRLHVFGYVERMHELMAVSACLVTKPGGLTLAEGLAAGLPLFLYRPVPGQERRNAEYMLRRGAAAIADTPERLVGKIMERLADPDRLIESKRACAALAPKRPADTLAMDFLSNLSIMVGKGSPDGSAAAIRKTRFLTQRGKQGETPY